MTLRDQVLDELGGDLEYHPRRGFVYSLLAAGSFAAAFYLPAHPAVRLTFVLGGLALLLKGYLLFRKTSEGLALTQRELDELSETRRPLPPVAFLAARVAQDFGAGVVLATPFLQYVRSKDPRWNIPGLFPVFGSGAILFALGWLVRYIVRPAGVNVPPPPTPFADAASAAAGAPPLQK
jgi:uncharacterized membrane protein YfcA